MIIEFYIYKQCWTCNVLTLVSKLGRNFRLSRMKYFVVFLSLPRKCLDFTTK